MCTVLLPTDVSPIAVNKYININIKHNIGLTLFCFSDPDLTLNLPTTTIVAQPFNIIKWQLKFNPVA